MWLRGPISTSGFDDNIVAAFRKGFPVIWEELIKDYLKHRERYDFNIHGNSNMFFLSNFYFFTKQYTNYFLGFNNSTFESIFT